MRNFIKCSPFVKAVSILFVLCALLTLVLMPARTTAQESSRLVKSPHPDSLYAELDSFIRNKPLIFKQKEERIESLREIWEREPNSYLLTRRLFNEYKSYLYDSAYVYANRLLDIAETEKDPSHIAEAKTSVMFCLLSAGLFKEVGDVAASVNLEGVDREARIAFFTLMARYNFSLASYNENGSFSNDYTERGCQYCDSVIALLPPGSKEAAYTMATRHFERGEYEEAIPLFERYLYMSVDVHDHAIAYANLNMLYTLVGDKEKSLQCVINAAIDDIRGGVTETTALRMLASNLYERGDLERANHYIGLAMEDATFYNARHRKMEIGSIMPSIEEGMRSQQWKDMHHQLKICYIAIGILATLLCTAVVFLILQKRNAW